MGEPSEAFPETNGLGFLLTQWPRRRGGPGSVQLCPQEDTHLGPAAPSLLFFSPEIGRRSRETRSRFESSSPKGVVVTLLAPGIGPGT